MLPAVHPAQSPLQFETPRSVWMDRPDDQRFTPYEPRCAVYAPPTTAQLEVDRHDTPETARGMVTTVGRCHGVGLAPVSTVTPACVDAAGVLPTAAQEPIEGHETSKNVATVAGTGSEVHEAPPLALVRIKPWPVLVWPCATAVVPTATQLAPATLGVGAVDGVAVVGSVVDGDPAGRRTWVVVVEADPPWPTGPCVQAMPLR
jgi:hypothetical protein